MILTNHSPDPLSGLFQLIYEIFVVFAVFAALFHFTRRKEMPEQDNNQDRVIRKLSRMLEPYVRGIQSSLVIISILALLSFPLSYTGERLSWQRLIDAGDKCYSLIWISLIAAIAVLWGYILRDVRKQEEAAVAEFFDKPTYNFLMNNQVSGQLFIGSTITGGTQHADHNAVAVGHLSAEQTVQIRQDLGRLRPVLLREARSPEHYAAIGKLAAAEHSAAKGDEAGMKAHLREAGQWAFEHAAEIGSTVLSKYLESLTGLK